MSNFIKKRYQEKNFSYRTFFLVAMLFLLISISACSKKKAVEKKLEDIRTGTQGITLNFLPNAPPDKIHAEYNGDNTFDIILELRNKGAFPQPNEGQAPNGWIVLSGYDPKIITFPDGNAQSIQKKALEGKSTINVNGGLDIINFKGRVDVTNLNVEKYEPTLLATACYPYRTIAGPSVCIDPDPYSTVTRRKVCEVQSISLSNQGAPVAVTRIDEEALGGKTQFKITIKNVGGGLVYDHAFNECLKIPREQIDKIYVQEVKVGPGPVVCRPFIGDQASTSGQSGYIRLINGEGFIICDLPKAMYIESKTAYTTPITISLLYGYINTAEKKVQIKKEITSSGEGSSGTTTTQTADNSYEGYNPYG